MKTHLTRIALGTVALFFVCVIAGAAVLNNKSGRLSHDEPTAKDVSVAKNTSASEEAAAARSHRALLDSELIPDFAGQIRDEESLQTYGQRSKRSAKLSAGFSLSR